MSSKSVLVVGGGLAGLSCAVALAEAGFRVRLLEQRPFLGGRASSYQLPNGECVDNCQHVTLGCCTNLDDFYRRVGARDKIAFFDALTFVDSLGRRSVMQASSLPPPLHLAGSLAFFSALDLRDRLGIARALMAIARLGGRNRPLPPHRPTAKEMAANREVLKRLETQTREAKARGVNVQVQGRLRLSINPPPSMLEWLRSQGQSGPALACFWSVILVSALNEDLALTEASYGLDVFWKAFLANRAGYRIGLPVVPLSELYGGCRAAIERRGGEVTLRATVRALRIADGRIAGIEVDAADDPRVAGLQRADSYVFALPHQAVLDLFPPELLAQFPDFSRLETSPITGVHFWFDRDVMGEPFVAPLDRTTQWIFNKSRLYGGPGDGRYVQLVISASRSLLPLSRQEIIDLCLAELRDVLPDARDAVLEKAAVIKEAHATFSPQPGADAWRPAQRTALPNLFLAGDWTRTGWPATMEGAVRSGYLAAEAILEDAGEPARLLRPDLPVEGFSRLWTR